MTSSLANTSPDKQKKHLQRARADLEAARGRILDHEGHIDQVALKLARVVIQHSARLRVLRDANQAVLEAHTRQIEAASDLDALKDRRQGIVMMLAEEGKKVDELEREVKRVKIEAQRAQAVAMERLTDDERRLMIVELAQDKTMESISQDIEAEEARLELIHDADPGLLRDFEERARKIEKSRADMAGRQAALEELEASIQEVKETWEPALDDIIRRINDAFSYNFEQINCAGEVGVHKDEDFDKWSIEIKVKFRYDFLYPDILHVMPGRTLTLALFAERTRLCNSLTSTANLAANAQCRPFSTSCLCRPWPKHPFAWLMKSTKEWTHGTSAWSTSAWWILRATSTLLNTSLSHQSCWVV